MTKYYMKDHYHCFALKITWLHFFSSSGLFPPAWQQRVMDEVMSVWKLQLLQRNNDSELMLIRKKDDANITRARASFPLITLLIYLSARVLNLSSAWRKKSQDVIGNTQKREMGKVRGVLCRIFKKENIFFKSMINPLNVWHQLFDSVLR